MPASTENLSGAPFIKAIENTIARFNMFALDDRVLVGVSGGPDSMALLSVLKFLAPKLKLTLGVAHLNHGLRGSASLRDAAFVKEVADQLNLPCYVRQANVRAFSENRGVAIEEAGRLCRYTFFKSVLSREGYTKVALGHHADDNAEMILMNLFRGSGTKGLTGIPPVRDAWVVRPLIEQRRTMILEYLRATQTDFCEDETNQDPAFLRNRIRLQLLPTLKDVYNPNIVDALNRLSSILREEESWLTTVMQPLYAQALQSSRADAISLSLAVFNALPLAPQRRLLRMALAHLKGELRRITHLHIHDIIALAQESKPGSRLDLPDRIQVLRTPDVLQIIRKDRPRRSNALQGDGERNPAYRITLPEPKSRAESLAVKPIDGVLHYTVLPADQVPAFDRDNSKTAFLDMDKLQFPLVIRNILPGDRFRPLGAGGTQKVKKYLIDHKIPGDVRRKTAVLVSDTRIAWLVGQRIDDTFKVGADTRRVLKCELLLA